MLTFLQKHKYLKYIFLVFFQEQAFFCIRDVSSLLLAFHHLNTWLKLGYRFHML